MLSARGVEPDEKKVNAILKMPCPTDKKWVLRAMGMINFIGKFMPNLSAKTAVMWDLHNTSEFRLTTKHEQEWRWSALKTMLTTVPVLTYYNPTKKLKVSTDTFKDGLGAVLLQAEGDDWKSIAYTSRSMTEAECRYTQIEEKSLGMVFGLENFNCYVYGLPTFTA